MESIVSGAGYAYERSRVPICRYFHHRVCYETDAFFDDPLFYFGVHPMTTLAETLSGVNY